MEALDALTRTRGRNRPLERKIAIVAGATRGAGRGIARALGEQGATVYCTGRTTRRTSSPMGRPETIEDTATMVTEAGGEGIAVRVDHLKESEVRRLVARVRREQGRLDVLVNDIWGGDRLTKWGPPFWQLSAKQGLELLEGALFTHLITARHAAPLMVQQGGGLIVEVTDGDAGWHRGNLYYDLAKSTVVRLAFDMAEELKAHGVACVALTPGFMRSEAVLDHFGVTEARWRDAIATDPHFEFSETPLFVGRAVAALARDPNVKAMTGRLFSSWQLAKKYKLKDADGRRPDWGAHVKALMGPHLTLDEGFYRYWRGLDSFKEAMGA